MTAPDVAKTPQNPVALTIAGSDSSGGAGIQADLKTFTCLGVYGASVLTALTAQNTGGVTGISVMSPEFVVAQVNAVFEDLPVSAVKTGMLAEAGIIDVVAASLERQERARRPALVVDPVMVATSGARLLDAEAVDVLIRRLLPLADLVTPNLPEAAALTGLAEDTDPRKLAAAVLGLGPRAVLLKGGHGRGQTSLDLLADEHQVRELRWDRVAGSFHGTGCCLSAGITARLAGGASLERAVADAGDLLQRLIRRAWKGQAGTLGILPFESAVGLLAD